MENLFAFFLFSILFVLFFITCVILGFRFLFDPFDFNANLKQTPQYLYPSQYYEINPVSILTKINANEDLKKLFHPLDIEPSFTDIYPSGSFSWKQEDYIALASAHLTYLTDEKISDGWDVYGFGEFRITACSNNMKGFDSAEIRLYKEEVDGSYQAVAMDIRPLEEILMSSKGYYSSRLFKSGFLPAITTDGSITAEEALQIAEQAGGMEMRQKLANEGCDISINYDEKDNWRIEYWWFTNNLEFNLTVNVNSNNGHYEKSYLEYKCKRITCP